MLAFLKRSIYVVGALFLPVICNAQDIKWIVPDSTDKLKNPIFDNANAVKDGRKLYSSLCSPCHGFTGKGDGPVAGTLNPRPANHSSQAIQSQPDCVLFWKLSEGRGAMVAYKATLTETQRWSLISFIRTLKEN